MAIDRVANRTLREHGEALAWHALEPEEVERLLVTGPRGLDWAEVERRLERYGPNELRKAPPPSPWSIALHQFQSPLIYILLVAAVVTLFVGDLRDSIVIAAVLVLNAIVGFTQEWRAEKATRALMRMLAPRARVVRDGREQTIDSRELVPGDLVLLESGSRVPADLRLVDANRLRIDESALTGESIPAAKSVDAVPPETPMADRPCLAYAGTIVVSGRGRGYVVATGAQTELGAIAEHVQREAAPRTPLQRRLDRLAAQIGVIVTLAALAVFAVGLARGESLLSMLMVAVALAVSAIPEGLPVVFTVTMALGAHRMARRNAILRHLAAVETLGSTTTICTDKTGTLTENRMTVQEIWTVDGTLPLRQEGSAVADPAGFGATAEAPAAESPVYLTLLAGVLTNEASLVRTERGEWEVQGDPTEGALLVAAARLGLPPEALRAAWEPVAEIPFEPERRYSASLRVREGEYLLCVKGAPEQVLRMCRWMLRDGGRLEPLDPSLVQRAASEMAARGLRVLAMAVRRMPAPPPQPDDLPEPEALVFTGLQGMLDPPRPGVREAIAGARAAGIRILMLTGDHRETARAIALQLGLAEEHSPVLTGADLDGMDDATLRRQVRETPVYARVSPEHKLRIVRALHSLGEVVAVTGDGVNDAPALKAADIGIAMGRSGTDVAREAADMVLADDNFVSIYAAVEEGRVTFSNLRKTTFFLLTTSVAEVFAILAALLLDWPLLLLPAQILWLNLVTDSLQVVALGFEPAEPDVLRRPPRSPREGIVTPLLWERLSLAGITMAVGTLALFQRDLAHGGGLVEARTVALNTMVIFQLFHLGNARSEFRSAFALSPFSNPFLFVATAAALLVHVAALHFPGTQALLRVRPVDWSLWVQTVLTASSVLLVVELHKWLRRSGAAPVPQRQ